MIKANIERYVSYKESDIEWVEKLPSDWGVKRLKEILCEVVYGTSEKTKEIGKYEVLGMGDIDEGKVSFPKKRFIDGVPKELLLKLGDLLFNRTNSLALVGKVGLIEEHLEDITFASYLIRLRVKNNQVSRYFWYFLNSEYFIAYSRSNAIQTANQANLSSSKLRQFKIIHIPLRLQESIAHYLDTKTAQIDRKIDLLTQKATLYSNLKQSLINKTVTRGLGKSVPIKDSDYEWDQRIPENWQGERVKNIFKLVTDLAPSDNEFELLSLYTSIGVKPRKDMEQRGNKSVTTDGYWMVKKGDIIVNKLLAWMGAIGLSEYDGVTSPAYDILRKSSKGTDQRFYTYLFRTEKAQAIFKKQSRGIMDVRLRLYFDKFGAISVPFPPPEEQKAIADYLDTKTAQIDQIIQTINTQIGKLKELRKTLINDVVTGKIKVVENEY